VTVGETVGVVTRSWVHEHVLDDGRWRPFACSLGATLLVVGVHTGTVDWLLLRVIWAQQLGS
jgi:hypothetical protein